MTKRWKNLGKGINYEDYINQTLISYASLIEQGFSEKEIMDLPYGKYVMNGMLFYELHKNSYFGNFPPKMQSLLANLSIEPKVLLQKLASRQIQQASEMTLYELEMMLYFLTEIPIQIPENDIQQLFTAWSTQKPNYEQDIDKFVSARNELKGWIQTNKLDNNEVIGVNFGKEIPQKTQEAYLNKMKPFLNLTGYEFDIGESISFQMIQKSEKLMERKKSVYKEVEKTRQKTQYTNYGNRYGAGARTERYTESVYTGTDVTEIRQRELTLNLINAGEVEELFSLTEFLPHQYFDPEEKRYEIPYQQMARFECWVLALPQKWYCPSCKDY